MQCAYQCRVQSACFCCPKDNILSPLAHFTARQTQTAGGRERLGPKSATKNCLKPDIAGKEGHKKRDKCTEAFQRSFLFVAQSSFLAAGFLDPAKAQSFLGGGDHLKGTIISRNLPWAMGKVICGLLRKPGVQWEIVLDMNRRTPIHVLLACV